MNFVIEINTVEYGWVPFILKRDTCIECAEDNVRYNVEKNGADPNDLRIKQLRPDEVDAVDAEIVRLWR